MLPVYQQHIKPCCLEKKKISWKTFTSLSQKQITQLNFIRLVFIGRLCSNFFAKVCGWKKRKLDNFKYFSSPLLHCLWWWHVPVWILTGLVPGEVQEHPSLPSWSVISLLVTHTLLICSAEKEALGTGHTSSSPLMFATDKALISDWWVRSVQ